MPTYFHVDMDAFFVSVEEIFDPSLKGMAVVVGGQRDQRGVVSAASYEARKFGVHSAMPLRTAAKLCPHAVFVDGHMDRYRQYSERVYEVLCRFTPQVEMASIDEAYLDMTGTDRLHGPPLRAAHALHETVKQETQLNCSVGIATSRVVAKITSDQAKPNGVLWVVPGEEAAFLGRLELRKMPGVGKVTEQRLQALGMRTLADLQHMSDAFISEHLGSWGFDLRAKALGEDSGGWFDADLSSEAGQPKSISHEHTFSVDIREERELESTLLRLCEMVGRRLREHELHARTMNLKLRYTDFTTFTRAQTLAAPTQLDNEIFEAIRGLFRATWKRGSTIRLLGVGASNLVTTEGQIALLDGEGHQRWGRVLSAADRLRDKFGENAIGLASASRGLREKVHENPFDLPGKKPE